VRGTGQPGPHRVAAGARRRLPRRRFGVRGRADARRCLGVDDLPAAALAGLRPDALRALFATVLRRRLPGAARRIVGRGAGHPAAEFPQLGSSVPAPDLLRRPVGLGRFRRRGPHLMCWHLGWLGVDVTVSSLVLDPPFGLRVQSYAPRRQKHCLLNADGWGVGFFDASPDGAVPRRWRSQAPLWGDVSFESVAPALRSHCVVAAVRSATVGMPIEISATAPFTDGQWLLSHNGIVDRGLLPVSRSAESVCDSAMLAATIFERGLDALGDTIAKIAAVDPGARLNILAANGSRMLATAWGDTLSILRRADGVVLASEPYDNDSDWEDVPDRHLVEVTADGVTLTPLDPPKGP